MHEYLFFLCLPIIAFLYSAVGHGGASGYLALMSIFSYAAEDVKTIALTLNLFVAGIAFIQYYRAGHFDKKLFVTLASTSIPMAFVGGRLQLDAQVYYYILAVFLLLAALKLFIGSQAKANTLRDFSLPIALAIGAAIGFVSGLLGIGGGIILSPLILLLSWQDAKNTAGISALFIFVNSIAGLLGIFSSGIDYPDSMPLIILLVICGGLLGSYLGARKWSNRYVKKVLATVLILAALKILFT